MTTDMQGAEEKRLRDRRTRLLGPAYQLFYDRPLHLVRGEGVWLYDADGRAYLDAYNNVPHVGHCHPQVVEALARQAGTLNTHTRYLHETVLEYAERLTSKFPGKLDTCMFACTGSEANELAVRIARACTGGEGFIVTEHAYHGNTNKIVELSPNHDYVERGESVKTVPAPDGYRGLHRAGEPDLGKQYAAHVDDALNKLHKQGVRPAAFIIDTIFSSDGIFTETADYVRVAVDKVRSAGGLFIADEVQPGFGRTGAQMWGFERHRVVPDIVTLGKPMGNGHPLSAVVTTPEIVEKFAERARYFNTFGGNPVSCAAGLAVLDVLEREKLQDNAREVGAYLKGRLEEQRSRHELIGDVRGQGLYIGVELVRNRETREPASSEAAVVVNGLRDHGILIGTTGGDGNVLKLRPPMVFSRENADQLTGALEATLRDVVQ